jgi:chorismate synthase
VIVEGMPAGVEVRSTVIDHELVRRQRGYGRGARTAKIERDHAQIVSGLADGRTTGAPIGMRIVNADFANQPAEPTPLTAPRPGHTDLAGGTKYGLRDYRLIRERASARETAARVAAGGVARELLAAFGIRLGSFVTAVGTERVDVPLDALDGDGLLALAAAAEEDPMRCPEPKTSARMVAAVDEAKAAGETLGGVFVVFAVGVPIGLGSHVHWDRKLDGRLLQAVGSIHAVKGAEIGPAFDLAGRPGTQAVDSIAWDGSEVRRPTNRAGSVRLPVPSSRPPMMPAMCVPWP